ncbi:GNAT family N-acetyltransferase [Planomicrobium sp. CPCC 101110]|uniref:GNAT family N-acetyltransferase n=1 Tax=Planomicrobium sp. CPCC 101110 TaxID=2599619 RepID=UPI0011B6F124|nr:GNAT family N-acetyltransferase [Planomicrobium sp. CPCC 101110]TWT28366.1 GNAT family N-acetyltransferase [Planomicrobium sp. CPCC 101110]
MDIRILSVEDAEAYHALRIEALRNDPDAFAARLEDALKKPVEATKENLAQETAVTWGAFVNGELAGNVTISRNTLAKMNHRASVLAVYVAPESRGQGLARKLMEELIRYAENWSGLERLDLAVAAHNEPAKRLYAALGFETYGLDRRAMKTTGNYIDEDLMVKFI